MAMEHHERAASPESPPRWAYVWWLATGTLIGLGVAGLLTIGLFLLPLGTVLVLVGVVAPALRNRSAAFLPAGLGGSLLYLAWLNRGGPGRVCGATGSEISCVDAWSPWPFVLVAVVLVGTSIGLTRVLARRV